MFYGNQLAIWMSMSMIFIMVNPISGWFGGLGYGIVHHAISRRTVRLFGSAKYLERMVLRKKIEVDSLLRQHQSPTDPLLLRMGYVAASSK